MPAEIIGASRAIVRLRGALRRLAGTSAPLLLVGEKGVGKSLIAEHIHALSRRNALPIKAINFAIIPDRDQRIDLLGGGLPEFSSTRRGFLEIPTTVVLKHIDHAAFYLQHELAEALEGSVVTRPGTRDTFPVHCRPIFTLRYPLAYLQRHCRIEPRLFAFLRYAETINIPPLRHRPEDIPILAEHYLPDKSLYRILLRQLDSLAHGRSRLNGWPDNVLDLRAFIRTLMMCSSSAGDGCPEHYEMTKMLGMIEECREFSLDASLSAIRAELLDRALKKFNGNQERVARLLGLSGRSIRRNSN